MNNRLPIHLYEQVSAVHLEKFPDGQVKFYLTFLHHSSQRSVPFLHDDLSLTNKHHVFLKMHLNVLNLYPQKEKMKNGRRIHAKLVHKGLLFYLRGDRIQQIVLEKSDIIDVRAATVVDFIYACLLFYLKEISTIPISTTWVFIGLLGGRELAINLRKKKGNYKDAIRMIGKDTLSAGIGLVISLILAMSINENMRQEFFNLF